MTANTNIFFFFLGKDARDHLFFSFYHCSVNLSTFLVNGEGVYHKKPIPRVHIYHTSSYYLNHAKFSKLLEALEP